MRISYNEVPGFQAAVKRENDVRDAAFLDLTANICGIEIRQMTARDLLILDGIDNPILSGGLPSPAQLAHFLWLLSPEYRERSPFRRYLFARRVRKLPYIDAVKECIRYVDLTFQDSPGGSATMTRPFAGWCAHLIDGIAQGGYGWSEYSILNMPLKRTFQYLKCIRRRLDPDYRPHNPSDKVFREGVLAVHKARMSLLNILRRRAENQ